MLLDQVSAYRFHEEDPLAFNDGQHPALCTLLGIFTMHSALSSIFRGRLCLRLLLAQPKRWPTGEGWGQG